jgi:hypothetical protein
MKHALILTSAALTVCLVVLVCGRKADAQSGRQTLTGFTFSEIRFDESMGGKLPTPHLPSRWKLVGVANGEKVNTNALWFQDTTGTLYVITGFFDAGRFIAHPQINRMESAGG